VPHSMYIMIINTPPDDLKSASKQPSWFTK